MLRAPAASLLLALGLSACSQPALEPLESAAELQITPTQDVFRWGDPAEGLAVEATVSNTGTLSYYSRLGDGFNAADEQDLLFVAEGTSAWLERREGSTWVAVERPFLVEGTKVVRLRGGAEYRLVATLTDRDQTGTFRFRVTVGLDPDGTGSQSEAVSSTFSIE